MASWIKIKIFPYWHIQHILWLDTKQCQYMVHAVKVKVFPIDTLHTVHYKPYSVCTWSMQSKSKSWRQSNFLLTHYTRSNWNHAVSSSFRWVTRAAELSAEPHWLGPQFVNCHPMRPCHSHQKLLATDTRRHNKESQAQFILTSSDFRSKL